MLTKGNAANIDHLIRKQAALCRIRVYQLVNVGNHLHLVIKIDSRRLFPNFIRAITGLIARQVLKRERGYVRRTAKGQSIGVLGIAAESQKRKSAKKLQKAAMSFWIARPFTRLIAWGRDYSYVKTYMEKNRGQARTKFVAWGFDVLEPNKIHFLNTG